MGTKVLRSFSRRIAYRHTSNCVSAANTRTKRRQDERSTDKVFTIDIGKEKLDVAGQMSRIDVGRKDGQTVFNGIDYKSGRRADAQRRSNRANECSHALYLMAAQALVFGNDGTTPLRGRGWAMRWA